MKKIKQYRGKSGLTQKGLAEKLDLSLQLIVKYERGKREPTLDTLNNLSNIFGIELIELMADNEELISRQKMLK